MADLSYDPRIGSRPTDPMLQTIRLSEGKLEMGVCRWHAVGVATGVAQILDLTVHLPHRRQGFGRKLMSCAVDQMLAWHRGHQRPLRRVWGAVRQKEQVVARAFMLLHGFNHIGSVHDLFTDEDALIYVRTFD